MVGGVGTSLVVGKLMLLKTIGNRVGRVLHHLLFQKHQQITPQPKKIQVKKLTEEIKYNRILLPF